MLGAVSKINNRLIITKNMSEHVDLDDFIKKKLFDEDKPRIFVMIRAAKEVVEIRATEESDGILKIRVHTLNEKLPKWFTHGYIIDGLNLGFDFSKKRVKKKALLRHLDEPRNIRDPETRRLIDQFHKDFDGIVSHKRKWPYFKTQRFKKRKNYMKMTRKTL